MKKTGNSCIKGGVLLILSACAVIMLGLGIAYGQWPEASEDALILVTKTQGLINERSHNPQVQDLLFDVGMDFAGKNYGNAVKSFQRARRLGLLDSDFSDEEMNALKAVEVRALTLLAMQYRESREYDLAKYA